MSDEEKDVAIAHNWQGRAIPLDVLREIAALEARAKELEAQVLRTYAGLDGFRTRAEKAEATRDQLLELLKRKESLLQKAEASLAAAKVLLQMQKGLIENLAKRQKPIELKRAAGRESGRPQRSEEHTSELQ